MADTYLSTVNRDQEFQHQLKSECHEALQKAKLTLASHSLYSCAINLVIGLPKSGKSQLFSSSEVIMKSAALKHACYIKAQVSHNAVFVETNGNLFEPGREDAWSHILKSMKHYRPEKPFDSITVVIDVAELSPAIGACNATPAFELLEAALSTLTKAQSHPVPTYVLITHTDRISGFREYFSELSSQQRQQAWGVIMPEDCDSGNSALIPLFKKRYQNFLRRLNQQQIPRLHATRNPAKRCMINEFPVQIEQLYSACESLMHTLFESNPKTYCRGLFFTSARQSRAEQHAVETVMNSRFALTLHTDSGGEPLDRPYFIHDIFNKIIPIDYTQSQGHKDFIQKQTTLRQVAFSATGIASVLLVSALLIGFWQAQDYLSRTSQGFARIQEETRDLNQKSLAELIPVLMELHRAQNSLVHANVPALIRFPQNHTNQLNSESNQQESNRLLNQLLPRLINLTEKNLSDPAVQPAARYHGLKAYLMLATGDNIDRKFLERYLVSLIESPNPQIKNGLQNDLGFLLSQIDLKPNQKLFHWDIIKESRKFLTMLPREYLGYEILRAELQNQTTEYKNELFGQYRIPAEFTHEGFAKLVQGRLSDISAELAKSQWILDELRIGGNQFSQQKIADNILQEYSKKYVLFWTSFAKNFAPQNLQNLHDAERIVASLSQRNSPLLQLIDVISDNTQMMPGNTVASQLFNRYVAPKLTQYATLDQQFLPQLSGIFKQLEFDLHEINSAPDRDAAIFEKTKQRFSQPYSNTALGRLFTAANQYPYPINQLLILTGRPIWELMMDNTMSYINRIWFEKVYREYEQQIAQHYPFVKLSKNDISLANFNHFFSTRGSLHSFFMNNVADFLDTTQADWRLKEVDGLSLPLTQAMLEQLERANIIRQMFFSAQLPMPEVNFTLRTHLLSPTLGAVGIDLYGQRKLDYTGSNKGTALKWPFNPAQPLVRLMSYDENGKEQELKFTGIWALFRALDSAHVTRDLDSRHYLVKFNFSEQGEVVYELTAEREVNPFIPDFLSSFQLTHRLTA